MQFTSFTSTNVQILTQQLHLSQTALQLELGAGGARGKASAGVVHVYICVRILLYMCPETAIYVSSHYCYRRWWSSGQSNRWCIVLYMCPHTTVYVSSYYSICVLILPYVSSRVSSCNYMCPHATTCVLILLRVLRLLYMCPLTTLYMSSYCYTSSVRILLYVCPHTTIYVSSGDGRRLGAPPR
jgi:hypothetical protein